MRDWQLPQTADILRRGEEARRRREEDKPIDLGPSLDELRKLSSGKALPRSAYISTHGDELTEEQARHPQPEPRPKGPAQHPHQAHHQEQVRMKTLRAYISTDGNIFRTKELAAAQDLRTAFPILWDKAAFLIEKRAEIILALQQADASDYLIDQHYEPETPPEASPT